MKSPFRVRQPGSGREHAAGNHAGWGTLLHLDALYNQVGQQRGGLLIALTSLRSRRGELGSSTKPAGSHLPPLLESMAAGPFGTNPILAGYAIGPLAMELVKDPASDAATPSQHQLDLAMRVRMSLGPVFGALGDRLFWGALQPLSTLLGLLVFLLIADSSSARNRLPQPLGPGLLLLLPALSAGLLFLFVSLYWRRRAWTVGLRGEEALASEVRSRRLVRGTTTLLRLARLLLGIALGWSLLGFWRGSLSGPLFEEGFRSSGSPAKALLFITFILVGAWAARRGRVSPFALAGLAVAGAMALALLQRF